MMPLTKITTTLFFFGGGQDYEQTIVAKDLPSKKAALADYIAKNKVVLAICGGFQLLGQYYVQANGVKIDGLGIMGHYTLNQHQNRFIGDIKIHNDEFNETYYGFENHQGRTFLSDDEKPLGRVVYGNGNNKEDQTEGVHYKKRLRQLFPWSYLITQREPCLPSRNNSSQRKVRISYYTT